jgi:hypothetical protein
MSLILTSQKSSEANSRAYDYQNYFSQTMKIAKGSKIALNHVTINRNAFFRFTEPKTFFIYHGVEMPSTKVFKMRDMPDTTGNKSPLLADRTASLTSREMNNYVNYPQIVVIPDGEYSLTQLCENLQYNLNNPNAIYGGDFYRTGNWTVTPNFDANNSFQNISFDWEINTNTEAEPAFPETSTFLTKYPDNNSISYDDTTQVITGGDAEWNVGEFDHFINNSDGSIRYDFSNDNIIVGLTRVTDGERYQQMSFHPYDGGDILDCPEGIDFFDYAVSSEGGQFKIYQLHAELEEERIITGIDTRYRMKEYNYGIPVATHADAYVKFIVDNNNVKIEIYSNGEVRKTITEELKPIGNNTYQLVPKIAIKGTHTVTLGEEPKLLSITNKPIYPTTINTGGVTDISDCNIGWICNYLWSNGFDGTSTGISTLFDLSFKFLGINYNTFISWTSGQTDEEATEVSDLGNATIDEMETEKYFWSYKFDETLFTGDGGFKYAYLPFDNTKSYTFEPAGTVIIPYNTRHLFYHVIGTIDGAIGLLPRFKKGTETTVNELQVVQILGNERISLNNNDVLYIRIDLGSTYTMNGSTASVSKIISPILTDLSNVDSTTALGVRTYTPPERMYLDLNNAEDIYINSINVSIVTKDERYALDLAPSTSASFHIISP